MTDHQLDSFDPAVRRQALCELAPGLLAAPPAQSENVNLHFHSFFSYNAEGWSPSHIAVAAHKAGLYAAGLCDFDVLDGLEEFLQAGELLGLRSTVNLETRAYLREYADHEISSPGEPGVTYIMGAGFARELPAGSPEALGLADLKDAAGRRNVELISRINPHVPDIAVDYAADVLPLTPLQGATERHIMRAYVNKAEERFGTPDAIAAYWAELLGKSVEDAKGMLGKPSLEEAVRSKLAKKGGFGYVQPSENTFPAVDDFVNWVLSCRAIPMVTWLDGTSSGESDARAMLECLTAKGCAALNIIPDRNWNYSDPEKKALKVAKLTEMVEAADEMGLPINIGTEMNKAGLPFVDDLGGEVLSRFKDSFLRGARIMVGHTILLRYAGVSYVDDIISHRSVRPEPTAIAEKNRFFEAVGALPPLTTDVATALDNLGATQSLTAIKEAAERGSWSV